MLSYLQLAVALPNFCDVDSSLIKDKNFQNPSEVLVPLYLFKSTLCSVNNLK